MGSYNCIGFQLRLLIYFGQEDKLPALVLLFRRMAEWLRRMIKTEKLSLDVKKDMAQRLYCFATKMPKMYSSENLERFYFDYQIEWMPRGMSTLVQCSKITMFPTRSLTDGSEISTGGMFRAGCRNTCWAQD